MPLPAWLMVSCAAIALVACSRRTTPPSSAADAGAPPAATASEPAAARARPPDAHDDPEPARAKRAALVQGIVAHGWVKDARVIDAMRRVPRHLFVPAAALEEAYADTPLPIGAGQTISQPSLVAEMTEALELRGEERVLEIGTGSGYQAAILSLLAREVHSIEIVRDLGKRATARLRDLGYANVHVHIGDGYRGLPGLAPFDRVILTAAPPELPQALVDQLAEGGVLIAPVGEQHGTQWLVRVRKNGGKVTRERIEVVRFVPMVRPR